MVALISRAVVHPQPAVEQEAIWNQQAASSSAYVHLNTHHPTIKANITAELKIQQQPAVMWNYPCLLKTSKGLSEVKSKGFNLKPKSQTDPHIFPQQTFIQGKCVKTDTDSFVTVLPASLRHAVMLATVAVETPKMETSISLSTALVYKAID